MGLWKDKLSNLSRRSLVLESTSKSPEATSTTFPILEEPEPKVPKPTNTLLKQPPKPEASSSIQLFTEEEKELQDQLCTLSDELKQSGEGNQALQSQVITLSRQLTSSENANNELRVLIKTLSDQLATSREKTETLRSENQASQQEAAVVTERNAALVLQLREKDELSSKVNEKLEEKDKELRSRITELEGVLGNTRDENGEDLLSTFNRYSELKKELDEKTTHIQILEKSCLLLKQNVELLTAEVGTISKAKEELEESNKEMSERLQIAEDSLKKSNQTIQELDSEEAIQSLKIHQLQQEIANATNCLPRTIRSFLMMRLLEYQFGLPPPTYQTGPSTISTIPVSLTELTGLALDEPCTSRQLQGFSSLLPQERAYNEFLSHFEITFCANCSRPEFIIQFPPGTANLRDTTLEKYQTCEGKRVCAVCFKGHILETVEFGWWENIRQVKWFKALGCKHFLNIRCEADLRALLKVVCENGAEVEKYVGMYLKALILRQELAKTKSTLPEELFKRAGELSKRLINAKVMYSPFDPRFDSALVDETGCIPEFNPGSIQGAKMSTGPSPLPIFHRFFRRQTTPRTCMVCSKTLFEIDIGDVNRWKSVCRGFEGPWTWDILVFPTREIQNCDHELEVCRNCTVEHLSTALEAGPSACDKLSCPLCMRKLSHEEVRLIASKATFAKYEKFLLQTFLSNEPNFRWCLNSSCKNGQIYQEGPRRIKITCDECKFKMCFNHQIPWHNGFTCAQYDSQKNHGDPSFAATTRWIQTNTKPCPNCQVGIQKGEACFHMTCSQCGYEFCWECLADWRDIRNQSQNGHRQGCFFRTSTVSATGARGRNVEEALLRARR